MFTWSVVLVVDDSGSTYSLVRGRHNDSVFSGTKRECLNYIRSLPDD